VKEHELISCVGSPDFKQDIILYTTCNMREEDSATYSKER
jgi:hypothetical protein